MDHVGIDIGTYSTFVCSEKDRGMMLEDEMNKRSIRTVVDLTMPRLFGNRIRVDNRRSIRARRRNFPLLSSLDDYKHLFMFISYLKRLVNLKSVSFAVPYWYKDIHKRKLLDLTSMLGLDVYSIISDISATSLCLVKQENIASSFVIIDFGYSKTSAGFFSFRDNVLKLEKIKGIDIGSYNLDQRVIEHFIKKNNLEDNDYHREVIMSRIDYLKTILNSTDNVSINVDEEIVLDINREEYEGLVKLEIEKITSFLKEIEDEKEESSAVEIVGGNSNNYVIKSILPKNISRSLNPSESVSLGCSLISLVRRSRISFKDFCPSYSVKLKGSTVKPTILFSTNESPADSVKVTYKKKDDFELEVFEEGEMIGEIHIKVSSPELVPVTLNFATNSRGVLEVCKNKSTAEEDHIKDILVNIPSFDEKEKEEIRLFEEDFRSKEVEMEMVREKRSNFESLIMGLNQNLEKFGNEFAEHKSLIDSITNDLMCQPSSANLNDENNLHDKFFKMLRPVTDKLDSIDMKVKEDIKNIKAGIKDFTKKHEKMYTPGLYQLKGELFMLEKWENNFRLSIETVNSFESDAIYGFKSKIEGLMYKAEQEVNEKVKAEEAEKRKKEEAQKAEKESKPEAQEKKEDLIEPENEKSAPSGEKKSCHQDNTRS